MARELKIGEKRTFHVTDEIKVIAYAEDSESPFMDLVVRDEVVACLADVEAEDLINALQRSLAILPSSK